MRSLDQADAPPSSGGLGFAAGRPYEMDALLLQRIGVGDESALEAFHNAHAATLFAIASQLLFSGEDARDVLQETFVKIWKKAGTYDSRLASPLTWATMQLRSLCLDRMRRIHRYSDRVARLRAATEILPQHDGGTDFLMHELRDRVKTAMSALPGNERQCVMLAVFSEMTHEEVAGALSQPIGTIKSRMRRGMEKLRTLLGNAND